MIIKCDQCGKEFNRKPSAIKNNTDKGRKNYCSNKCKKLGQFTGKVYKCEKCGKEVYRNSAQVKKSKSGFVFCSKSCACSYNNSVLRKGSNNPNWKTGDSLYVEIAYNTYIKECAICKESNKDLLEVHHIDKNRSNNDPSNLIILCANHHSLVHRAGLEITDEIKSERNLI